MRHKLCRDFMSSLLCPEQDPLDFAEIVQLLSTDDAVQRLPFNSGLEGIRSFLLEKLNQEEHEINGFIDKIGSTYFCSPYPATSVDLMRAVADFYPFAFKVTQTTNWKYRDDYWKCVYQYYHFANMVGNTESPGMAPIPNIRIDLARHLHMLDPASYCRSKIWNHTIDIPKDETKAKQRAESTNCEWNIYLAKHKQSAGVVEMKRRKKKMSWTEGMLKRFQRLEKRSIQHVTNDANYSRVYQPNKKASNEDGNDGERANITTSSEDDGERVNITKSPDFDWLVPNTLWTDTLKPYREYPDLKDKIFLDTGTIGGYFAKKSMPSDAVKKLYYQHPLHHPPMTFEYYYSNEFGGGGGGGA
ncbi:hypothetical protein MBANPS3_009518 [Mucor bainieri]